MDSLSALGDLERVLERYSPDALTARDTVGAQALRGVVRRLAAEARARDPVRCEQLLLTLRCAWRDFPQVRMLSDQATREVLWRHIVRLCCEEFYGSTMARRRWA